MVRQADRAVDLIHGIADDVVAAGLDGILFPLQAHPGGTNLVIYRSSARPSSQLRVYDPEGALR